MNEWMIWSGNLWKKRENGFVFVIHIGFGQVFMFVCNEKGSFLTVNLFPIHNVASFCPFVYTLSSPPKFLHTSLSLFISFPYKTSNLHDYIDDEYT